MVFIRVNRDITIRLIPAKPIRTHPYEMIVDDNWSEIVVGMDLRGIREFKDCLEEFLNEETDRGQSGPDSTPNRLPA